MHNRKKILTISLALFFLLVLVVIGSQNDQMEEETIQQGIYVTDKKESPLAIEVIKDNHSLSFVKEGGEWVWEEKKEVALDQDAFLQLEKSAKVIQADRVIENGQDLQAFGLSEPESIIHVTFQKGKETYFVSEQNPTGSHYLMKEGDQNIYVITPRPGDLFSINLSELRDKNIPFLDAEQALEIKIQRPGNNLLFIKNAPDSYLMLYAYEDPYDVNMEVFRSQILDSINRFKIKDFSNHTDPKFTGLADPLAVISLTYEDGLEQTLYFGNMPDDASIYFALEGWDEVYTMEVGYLERILLAEPFHLIVQRFKSGSLARWQQIIVDGNVLLAQKNGDTQEISYFYNDIPVETEKVEAFYESLNHLEIEGEITEAIALIEPKVQVSFIDWDGVVVQYRFIEYQNDYYAVERNNVMNFYVSKEMFENFTALFFQLAQ